jgi:hypothetical protein
MSVIDSYDGTSMRVIGTFMSLEANDHHKRMYTLLNGTQKAAVAQFLAHVAEVVPFRFNEETEIAKGMESYWNQHLRQVDEA